LIFFSTAASGTSFTNTHIFMLRQLLQGQWTYVWGLARRPSWRASVDRKPEGPGSPAFGRLRHPQGAPGSQHTRFGG
jgi:hypothetical protein